MRIVRHLFKISFVLVFLPISTVTLFFWLFVFPAANTLDLREYQRAQAIRARMHAIDVFVKVDDTPDLRCIAEEKYHSATIYYRVSPGGPIGVSKDCVVSVAPRQTYYQLGTRRPVAEPPAAQRGYHYTLRVTAFMLGLYAICIGLVNSSRTFRSWRGQLLRGPS